MVGKRRHGMTLTTWLYTMDDLRTLSEHADPNVRRWAVGKWIERHPRTDLIHLARRLLDADVDVVRDVALHLAQSGEARWASVLIRAFELRDGLHRLAIVEAMGVLGHPSHVSHLTSLLRKVRDGVELVTVVRALGGHRVDTTWRTLLPMLDLIDSDDAFSAVVVRTILGLGRRDDVTTLVARWRAWSDTRHPAIERAFLDWLGADEVIVDRLRRLERSGPGVVVGLWERDGGGALDPTVIRALVEAWTQGPLPFLRVLHRQAVRMLLERTDDLAAWLDMSLGPPVRDYRALVVAVDALLGALAARPPAPERALAELRVGLGAFLCLAGRADDLRAIRDAASPLEEALRIVASGRREVASEVADVVVAHKGAALPGLIEILGSDATDEALTRAARLVGRLVIEGVRCVGAVPVLTSLMLDRSGSGVSGAAVETLALLGPDALPALLERLDDDPADELFEALARIPTAATFDALTAWIHDSVLFDLRAAEALTDLGDPRAIDLLAPAWSAGHVPLAAMLDGLASMHNVAHPQRAAWRRDLDRRTGEDALTAAALAATPAES